MKINVKAPFGVKVPFEHQPFDHIEQQPVEVDDSVYYRRRIADGDLEIVPNGEMRRNRNPNTVKTQGETV